MVQRIIVSLTYAVAAVASALTATGIPDYAEAWVGLRAGCFGSVPDDVMQDVTARIPARVDPKR